MTINTQKFEIVNGPGKFDLMVGLFEGKPLTFSLTQATAEVRVTVHLYEVGQEDGSCKSWLLEGRCYMPGHALDWVNFDGYYHSVNRRGHISLNKPISEIGELLAYGELRQYKIQTK